MITIQPYSCVPITAGRLFSSPYISSGAVQEEIALGVEASLGGDAIWRCYFEIPEALPTGTHRLRLRAKANATSGIARVNPKWVSVAEGESSAAATPLAEGVTADSKAGQAGAGATLEWGTGDADQILAAYWTLNADTVVANEIIRLDLVFETTGYTLAAASWWWPSIQLGT